MDSRADDDRLLAVARAIGDGSQVDWAEIERQVDAESTTLILKQLRVVDHIASVHAAPAAPTSWGKLSHLEPIGHGAFGTVYRAVDPDLKRDVALKVTGPPGPGAPFDPDRLVREAQMLARVRHPNVVTVFGAERRGDEVGVSMELIEGETLSSHVRAAGPYSAREATIIGLDICRAVAAVHAAGLLHGDIKAHNVMREQGGRIVLMDFGAGRDLKRPAPGTSDAIGTPLYVAPEVFAGRPRSRASDVYSLGVLLFYLATGAYPVEGDSRSQILEQHRQRRGRRRLRDVRPDLPDAFIQVVERATADEPAQRHQSAGELEAHLRTTLAASEPAPARPPDRRPLAMAAVLVVAALIGAAYWNSPRLPADGGAAATSVRPPLASAPPAAAPSPATMTYRVQAAMFRAADAGPVRLLPNSRVAPDDLLFLEVDASIPVRVYVISRDDRGETYLLFPLPGQPAAPLAPGPNRLPGTVGGSEKHWQVTSAGGREQILIYVNPLELPELEEIRRILPPPKDADTLAVRLRGIGGIVTAPESSQGQPAVLNDDDIAPLPLGPEVATGLWKRQITFTNPAP